MPRGDDDERAAVCAPLRRRRLPRVALEVRALPDMLDPAPAETVLARARASAESLRSGSDSPSPELLSLLSRAAHEQREEAPCVRLLADACVDSLCNKWSFSSLWDSARIAQLVPTCVPGVVFLPSKSSETRSCQHLLRADQTRTCCGRRVTKNWLPVVIGHLAAEHRHAVMRRCKICARSADEGSTPYSFRWLADTRKQQWELSADEQEWLRACCRAGLFRALSEDAEAMRITSHVERLRAITSSMSSGYRAAATDLFAARVDPRLWLSTMTAKYPDVRELLDDVYGGSPPPVSSAQIVAQLRLLDYDWPGTSPAKQLCAVFLLAWPEAVPELRRRGRAARFDSILAQINACHANYTQMIASLT